MTAEELPEPPSLATLLRGTGVAAAVAAVLLITIVLPAEYGVDPLGTGRALGLYRPSVPPAATELVGGTGPGSASAGGAPLARTAVPFRSDDMSLELAPGEGAEIKAVMGAGHHFVYHWTAKGGAVDVDMHGEPFDAADGEAVSYWKDEWQSGDQGVFTAPVPGRHGWFWQNLNDEPVTVTVRTSGFYERLVRP